MPDSSRNLRVKFTTSTPSWPIRQQTPGGMGRWENIEFYINQPVEECDAWFIYDGLPGNESTICPPENIVLLTAEPSSFKRYHQDWLQQFPLLITSQRGVRHPNVRLSHTALPWLMKKSYDELTTAGIPEKSRPLSVIASTKTTTRGHRQRLNLVRHLVEHLPMDVYGRGFAPLEDKWTGLAPYRYSIAIENSAHPDYWTEKITDCFLAGTIPIYFGCPNIADFFPAKSFIPLDVRDNRHALLQLKDILANDDYEARKAALLEAQDRVLHQHNLFNLVSEICATLKTDQERRHCTLTPEPAPSRFQRRLLKWKRRLGF